MGLVAGLCVLGVARALYWLAIISDRRLLPALKFCSNALPSPSCNPKTTDTSTLPHHQQSNVECGRARGHVRRST
eukprot:341615-Chlamydomonas_euryale.AAC.3